jgi:hypothetical protein
MESLPYIAIEAIYSLPRSSYHLAFSSWSLNRYPLSRNLVWKLLNCTVDPMREDSPPDARGVMVAIQVTAHAEVLRKRHGN